MPLHIENTVTATFKITTPMFIGDANKHAECIRPASIKGALRFWWRALNWHTHLYNANNNINAALKSLHKEEALLFGAAAEEDSESKTSLGGQGVFLLHVHQPTLHPKTQEEIFGRKMNSAHKYLLGLGLTLTEENQPFRKAIGAGEFNVQLLFKKNASDEHKKSVLDALYAFGLLGALGTRARHGMGSVSLIQWKNENNRYSIPTTRKAYKEKLGMLLEYIKEKVKTDKEPPISALSEKMRMEISAENVTALNLLSQIGDTQLLHRSYGRDNKLLLSTGIVESKKKYSDDHDLLKKSITYINSLPKRTVFGLPHNYRYSSGRKVSINYFESMNERRRASPLLLHIHHLKDDNIFVAVHCLLQGLFLPKEAQITIQADRQDKPLPASVEWKNIHNYLNEFQDREIIDGK